MTIIFKGAKPLDKWITESTEQAAKARWKSRWHASKCHPIVPAKVVNKSLFLRPSESDASIFDNINAADISPTTCTITHYTTTHICQ